MSNTGRHGTGDGQGSRRAIRFRSYIIWPELVFLTFTITLDLGFILRMLGVIMLGAVIGAGNGPSVPATRI